MYAQYGRGGDGDSPGAPGAPGPMLAALHDFRAQQGFPPMHLGDRRGGAAATYDEVPHRQGYDGQHGAGHVWPHNSVGVVSGQAPGVMSSAPAGFSGDRRGEAAATYDEVPHRQGYDGQYGAGHVWPHNSVGVVSGPAPGVQLQPQGGWYAEVPNSWRCERLTVI